MTMLDTNGWGIPEAYRARAAMPSFWRELCLGLRVDAPRDQPFAIGTATSAGETLEVEGYFRYAGCLPTQILEALTRGAGRLRSADIPAVYLFLYDEVWQVASMIADILSYYLGPSSVMLPNIWAWDLASRWGGWPPHRDLDGTSAVGETLISLSAWVPLNRADRSSGCMAVLPGSHRAAPADPPPARSVLDTQGLYLEAEPGDLLGWRQDLLHWGTPCRPDHPAPRQSLGFEFQNPAFEPRAEPLLDPRQPPDFGARLSMIRDRVLAYSVMVAQSTTALQ